MGRSKRTEVISLVEEKQPDGILQLETCNMFMEKCRHCSREHTLRPYTKIEKDETTGLFKPVGLGSIRVDLGLYCNDAGKWVDQMNVCPIKWDKANYTGVMAEYNKKVEKEAKKKAMEKVKMGVEKAIKKPVRKVVTTPKRVITKKVIKK
jgi:hypothetical protein